ncbi:MAG: ATP-binding protein [Verrucomicrobiota bacterium]
MKNSEDSFKSVILEAKHTLEEEFSKFTHLVFDSSGFEYALIYFSDLEEFIFSNALEQHTELLRQVIPQLPSENYEESVVTHWFEDQMDARIQVFINAADFNHVYLFPLKNFLGQKKSILIFVSSGHDENSLADMKRFGQALPRLITWELVNIKENYTTLERLFNNSSNSIGVISGDGAIIKANKEFERLTGLGSGQKISGSICEFIHPNDREAFSQICYSLKSGKEKCMSISCRVRTVKESHSRIWMTVSLFTCGGYEEDIYSLELVEMARVKMDQIPIVQREQFLEAIIDFQSRLFEATTRGVYRTELMHSLSETCEASRVYIVSVDGEDEGTYQFRKECQWVSPQVDSGNDEKRLHDICYQRWHSILTLGEVISGQTDEFPSPECEVLKEYQIGSILLIPMIIHGKLRSFLGIDHCFKAHRWNAISIDFLRTAVTSLTDIIEKREGEQILKLFEIAIRESSDGIIMTDDGMESSSGGPRIVFVNEAVVRLTGYAQKQLIGNSIDMLYGPETDLSRVDQILLDLEEGIPHRTELTLYKNSKVECLCDLQVSPLRDSLGRIINHVIILRDVTLLRKHAKERLRADKMESISLLACGIAHDFNNHLGVISGYLSLALSKQKELENELHQMIEISLEATKKAQALARQLLAFSKNQETVKRKVFLQEMIQESCHFASHGCKSNIELIIEDHIWPVEADLMQITQVVQNLLLNAKQAMMEPGEIVVIVDNVFIGENSAIPLSPGKYVLVRVEDTGSGISKENLEKIFDPYFTTKKEGNGLGLPSCFTIISQHEGHLAVESEEGHGSRFTFYLPATDQELERHTTMVRKLPLVTRKVLIIDYESEMRNLLERSLENAGYKVTVAANTSLFGSDNGSKSRMRSVDIMIIDIAIIESIGAAKAMNLLKKIGSDLKIVLTGSEINESALKHYQSHGYEYFIPKPYNPPKLIRLIDQVFSEISSSQTQLSKQFNVKSMIYQQNLPKDTAVLSLKKIR